MKFNSIQFKIITCLLTGIAFIQVLLYSGRLLPPTVFTPAGKNIVVAIFIFLPLAWVLIYPFIWQHRENKNPGRSAIIFARLHCLMRSCFAFIIASYGFAKILGLQFQKLYSVLDVPLGDQSGPSLTWNYFGYSFVFVCVIACIQLAGAMLLLFRRTYVAGVIILLPVMVNILCIDVFYTINDGALLNSILLNAGLIYLLLLNYRQLVDFLFRIKNDWPVVLSGKGTVKNILRLLVMLIPFLATLAWKQSMKKTSFLSGTYEVVNMKVNNRLINADAVRKNDSLLTRIYFEVNNTCVLQYNNINMRLSAAYQYDAVSKNLEANLINKEKTKLDVIVKNSGVKNITISGMFGSDTVNINLEKVR